MLARTCRPWNEAGHGGPGMTLDTGALRLVMVLQESSESVSGCRRGGEGRGGEGRGGEGRNCLQVEH